MTHPTPEQVVPMPATDTAALVLAELARVHDLTGPLRDLVTTRQTAVNYLSVEAAKAQDDLIRAEKAARYRTAVEGIKLVGHAPAPGAITPITLLVEWHDLLVAAENDAATRLSLVGPRPLGDTTRGDDPVARVQRVADLVALVTDRRYLERLHRDLVDLGERIDRCVDGPHLIAAPRNCPWCGRDSLVVDLKQMTTTCSTDRASGRVESCVCSDPLCACKSLGLRHVWYQARGT